MSNPTPAYIGNAPAAVPLTEDQIPDGVITPDHLAAEAVTTAKIDDGAVTHVKRTYNAGEVIQSVSAEYTANAALATNIPIDDTIPQNTEGTEVLTASITPKSAASKIRVKFVGFGSGSGAGASALICALFKDADANAIAATSVTATDANYAMPIQVHHEETAGSTSARTYKVRVGSNTGTMRLNGSTAARYFGGVAKSVLVVEEIAV